MTVAEWLTEQLKEAGVTKREASKILGKNRNWLTNKCGPRGSLDVWEAICIVTDINRYVRGMEPRGRYNRWYKQHQSKINKVKRAKRREEEYDPYAWY